MTTMRTPSFSISLEGDLLVSSAVGALGHERRVEIPVPAIEGYCIAPTGQAASAMIPWDAYLVVAWREGSVRKHEKAPVLRDDPRVGELISALERLRPDASLLSLPPRQAMKKLGVRSARTLAIWIGVVAVLVIGIGGLVGGLYSKRTPRGDRCGSLPVSCLAAVDRYLSDPENAPMAARELDTACSGGNLSACATLGPFLLDGAGVPTDERRALDAVQRACSGGLASGCNNLGVMYATGRAVDRSDAKAADLYKRACDLGDVVRGCYNFGSVMVNGIGVEKDEARGAEYLRRACEAGESNGCLTLGALYFEGRGVPADRERARRLFERACQAGNESACHNLQLK